MEREIKVVYDDDSQVVYADGERLNEKEIVDLLIEYMEENNELHKEILDLKVYTEQLNLRIERLKVKRDRERNATAKQHQKWDKEAQEKINHLHEENQQLKNKRWKIIELIIEYDTTNKYSEKDVIDKVKDILNLVMIE